MTIRRTLILLITLAAGALACSTPALGGAQTPTETPPPPSRTIVVRAVSGPVEVETADRQISEATVGQELGPDDQLRTYASGEAVLEVDNSTAIVVAENSTFVVRELSGGADQPINHFFLNVGAAFGFHTGDPLPEGASFEIDTPSGNAAIRGSAVGAAHGLPADDSAGEPAHARPVRQIGGTTRVTCAAGDCQATGGGNTSDLGPGDAVNISGSGSLGSVGPFTEQDKQAWRDAIEALNNAGLLPDFEPETDLTAAIPVVPDLTGLSIEDATALLLEAGFSGEVLEAKACENVDAGQVSAQDPAPGIEVEPGTVVGLVECTGPPGTGDVQATLRWSTTADLDLTITDPDGFDIYYDATNSPSGGELDVDANAYCEAPLSTSPVENIFWDFGEAPTGTYEVGVVYSLECQGEGPVEWSATVTVDGSTETYSGTISPGEFVTITTFSR